MDSEFEKEGRGSGFVMGLLTGTVLGAGLGMLFAPKKGSEMRGQLSDTANTVSRSASQGYRRAAGAANTIAEKSRGLYGRAREAVSRGAEEAKRSGNQGQERISGSSRPSDTPSGS
jgi:gas vesicle protein